MRKGCHSTEATKTWKTALTGFTGRGWPGRASRVSLSHLDISVSEHSQAPAGPQPWRLGSASLVAQLVKNLPVMQETRVRFLGWEDPLEKKMATHSSILAWRIPWTEEPSRL